MSFCRQSSSPEEEVAERKRKRMVSNRESARRSRMRKQQHVDGLSEQLLLLQGENRRIAVQLDLLARQLHAVDSQNAMLRTQAGELTERLRSMTSLLRFDGEFGGVADVDVPEVEEEEEEFPYNPLMKQLQLVPSLANFIPMEAAVVASGGVFRY